MLPHDNFLQITYQMLLNNNEYAQFTLTKTVPQPYATFPYDVTGDFILWGTDITDDTTTYAPGRILDRLRGALTTGDRVVGVKFLWYAQGVAVPEVYVVPLSLQGNDNPSTSQLLPTFVSASYYAPSLRYRQKGTGFRVPVRAESSLNSNGLSGLFGPTGPMGNVPGTGIGFVEMLNDLVTWQGPDSNRTYLNAVVRRVPNTKPHGSGSGTRLPTFPSDIVEVWQCGNYSLNPLVTTQRTRRARD
jgi:hypothetical protein